MKLFFCNPGDSLGLSERNGKPRKLDLNQSGQFAHPLICKRSMNESGQMVNKVGAEIDAHLHERDARLSREFKTIKSMVHIYCRDHHGSELCDECKGLMDYAGMRLDRCRFGAEKPTCAKCPVHCYQRNRREQVKIVMRYAGPRMLWEHPLLSLRHWLDGFRAVPSLK